MLKHTDRNLEDGNSLTLECSSSAKRHTPRTGKMSAAYQFRMHVKEGPRYAAV